MNHHVSNGRRDVPNAPATRSVACLAIRRHLGLARHFDIDCAIGPFGATDYPLSNARPNAVRSSRSCDRLFSLANPLFANVGINFRVHGAVGRVLFERRWEKVKLSAHETVGGTRRVSQGTS